MAGLGEAIMYVVIGAVIGFGVSIFIVPTPITVMISPVLLGAGYVGALAAGIAIGRQIRPRKRMPMNGRVYPLSMSELGTILEYAMKSIGGGEK
jgi:hypothetical protein